LKKEGGGIKLEMTTHKNSLRLMIMLIYYALSFPMHLRPIKSFVKGDEHSLLIASIIPLVFLFFILIECIEFYYWRYQYKNKKITGFLFFFRVLVIALLFSFFPGEQRFFILFSFSPPIIFYAYYVFPMFWNILLILLIASTKLIFDILFNPFVTSSNQVFFTLLFTTTIDILFYGLAWFLDRDQKQSLENQNLLEQLRDYATKVGHSAAMEERTRLARDFHDTLGHSLTAIQIQLSKAEAYLKEDPEEALMAVRAAKLTAKDAMYDVRTSVSTLNSNEDIIDFSNRVHKILEGMKSTGLEVNFEQKGVDSGYNFSVLSTLLRIVQEGLTNILRHADANRVKLTITFGLTECHLILIDDGCGFIVREGDGTGESPENHFGLKGLKRRMELVRGTLTIQSTPGSGTTIRASLPKDPVQLIGDKS
jgi:signal transduction histidine kinase